MHALLSVLAAAPLALVAPAALDDPAVGSPLPEKIELEDFTNLAAGSFDQFAGRAVLIEFFAHW